MYFQSRWQVGTKAFNSPYYHTRTDKKDLLDQSKSGGPSCVGSCVSDCLIGEPTGCYSTGGRGLLTYQGVGIRNR